MVRLANPRPGRAPPSSGAIPRCRRAGRAAGPVYCSAGWGRARIPPVHRAIYHLRSVVYRQYTSRATVGLPLVHRRRGDARGRYHLLSTPTRLLARSRPGVHGRIGARSSWKGRFWYTVGLRWPGNLRAEESLLTNQPLCQLSYAGLLATGTAVVPRHITDSPGRARDPRPEGVRPADFGPLSG
jgi:hypothetical protein